jgi:hypothetical protein
LGRSFFTLLSVHVAALEEIGGLTEQEAEDADAVRVAYLRKKALYFQAFIGLLKEISGSPFDARRGHEEL